MGQRLPYRRRAGESPPGPTPLLAKATMDGWRVDFLVRSETPGGPPAEPVHLGDLLLSLSLVRALSEATGSPPLSYHGDRGALMSRCDLPIAVAGTAPGSSITTAGSDVARVEVRPVRPPVWPGHEHHPDRLSTAMPIWLDPGDGLVDVHACLPSRLYLQAEQDLGVRLPADGMVAPTFGTRESAEPGHVVFVATTSSPDGKDFGHDGFIDLARELTKRSPMDLRFTLVTNDLDDGSAPAADLRLRVASGIAAEDCVDLFGTADLVVGNDTGLTHLAALTARADHGGPEVIGLYNIFSPLKWNTGSPRHHAIATAFSQMVALSDVDIYVNQYGSYIDPAVWADGALVDSVPPATVAAFAATCLGW
ncbi:hypothetical protein Snas_3298 [Stackebrandtia nassauensis DSM 44728]|uniref:Glycosyl transferase family 9 n=2 Tax=Stackebrandtia TaxID=283810 RepID=D3PUF3_STANL|nr:hypothetical protein Snas_3298 [Stackebrandtia nassauensis DSM 44728]